MTGSRVATLVAAGGAAWETDVLERLAEPGSGVVLVKRCVDLPDLLATAATGTAQVAVVAARLTGLDADSVSRLARLGVGVVVVGDGVGDGTPADRSLTEDEGERVRRLGVSAVVDRADLASLVDQVRSAGAAVEREPASPGSLDRPGLLAGLDDPLAELERLEEGHAGPAAGRGRLVAVWGPTGSPGRTTVAVGLAAELADRGQRTLLLDVDPYAATVAQHLGMTEEVSGLLAAARLANGGHLDPVRLAGLARQAGPGLRVLTGLPRPDRWSEVRPQAFTDLLDVARLLDEMVVVDAGPGLDREPPDPFDPSPSRSDMTLTSLAEADLVVAVGSADPVGLTRLARGLLELVDVRASGPDVVVVNRMRPSLGWAERDLLAMVEQIAPRARVCFLPDDRAGADRALVSGRSLVESGDGPLRRAVTDLAELVSPAPGPVTPPRAGGRRGAQALSRR